MIETHLYIDDAPDNRGPAIVLNPAHILWASEELVTDRGDSPDWFTRVRMINHDEFVIFMEWQEFVRAVK